MDDEGIVVVNFAHPLTEAQRAQIETLTGQAVVRVLDVLAQIDTEQALPPQAVALVGQVGLSGEEWQMLPVLINLPGLTPLAAVLLAELHGRMGHFPTVLRIRPVAETASMRYEVGELLNLQDVRDTARKHRQSGVEASGDRGTADA